MATMTYTTIIAVFAVFVIGQAEAGWPFELDFKLQTPDTKCGQLTAALEAFWEALPEKTPNLHMGGHSYIVVSRETIYRHLRGIFYWKLGTPESRMEVACGLVGVKNVSDLVPLYNTSPYRHREPDYVMNAYYEVIQDLREMGIETLKDMGNFAGLLNYTFRITGFPKFPIDLYDMQMTRDFGDRVLQHISLWEPNLNITEERKQMFANALMSNTPIDFQLLTGLTLRNLEEAKNYVDIYTDMLKALSNVISMFEEMGLLDL